MMYRKLLILTLIVLMVFPAAAQEATPEPTPMYLDPAELADADGKFADVDGASVYYVERGTENEPVVLLLHGFLGSVVDWTNVIDVLAEAGYHVIAFDRPPFGLSDKSIDLDYSLDGQADLTVGLMDALDIETASLVGHSAGGPVVANVALRYPERVEKLAFVAPAIGLSAADAAANEGSNPFAGMDMLANLDPENPMAQAIIRNFFTSDFAQNLISAAYSDTEHFDPIRAELSMRGTRVEGWEAGFLAYAKVVATSLEQLTPEDLQAIELPMAFLWGEDDQIVPLAVGERLHEALPDAGWITYPDVGHIPQDEITEAFNADLLAFLLG